MKYVIFGSLLILMGFAAMRHEAPVSTDIYINKTPVNIPIYNQVYQLPTIKTESLNGKPLVKFVHEQPALQDSNKLSSNFIQDGGG